MKLKNLAKTIRSKNAGVDHITFDIIFKSSGAYKRIKDNHLITPKTIARLYHISQKNISFFSFFDPALALKFSLKRQIPSGSPGDPDTYGCQQYAPLLEIEV